MDARFDQSKFWYHYLPLLWHHIGIPGLMLSIGQRVDSFLCFCSYMRLLSWHLGGGWYGYVLGCKLWGFCRCCNSFLVCSYWKNYVEGVQVERKSPPNGGTSSPLGSSHSLTKEDWTSRLDGPCLEISSYSPLEERHPVSDRGTVVPQSTGF